MQVESNPYYSLNYTLLSGMHGIGRADVSQVLTAEKVLAKADRDPNSYHCVMHQLLTPWCAIIDGRPFDALAIFDSLLAHPTLHAYAFMRPALLIGRAQALLATERHDEAAEVAAEALAEARTLGSSLHEVAALWFLAAVARRLGRDAVPHMRAGLALARRCGVMNVYFLRRVDLAVLCLEALEHGIETDFARALIRRHDLRAPQPCADLPVWPAALRVQTLGAFSIERNGMPVSLGRKLPQRPVALLLAVIAFGGTNVSLPQIIDALWPELDGDAARGAFKSALHRLRKLLGNEHVIQVTGQQISLDTHRIWVDVWADGTGAGAASDTGNDTFAAVLGDPAWALAYRRQLAGA